MKTNLDKLGYIIAEQPKQTIVCVGAGLPARYGLPNWSQLNNNLYKRLIDHKDKYAPTEILELNNIQTSISDPWTMGTFLKEKIPPNLYIEWIREELGKARSQSPTYRNIWSLGVKGIISYNLDNLVIESSPVMIESQNTSYGMIDENALQFFIRENTWVYFPHGNLKRPDSWIFTREHRTVLHNRDTYKRFCTTAFTGYHVVLIGINPKDYSLESILQRCLPGKNQGNKHFWIHADPTPDDIYFARENGLDIIKYSSTNNFKELDDIIIDLGTYRPREKDGTFAYYGDTIDPKSLPNDVDLSSIANINEVRHKLNAAAKYIIDQLPPDSSEEVKISKYLDFTSNYPRSMKLSMLVQPNSPGNDLIFGYKAEDAPSSGAFGRVFQVRDITNDGVFAVKIMRDDIFSDKELLQAFRRGATASKILTEKNVPGMVKYKASYEIPPCIFMEYVNGPTLDEFVRTVAYASKEIYETIIQIASIIRNAHDLSECVLHRDLKPQNVMLRDFYFNNCEFNKEEIVLLDFDLSWYKGAVGQSIVPGAGSTGYAAPEQYEKKKLRSSTQTTAVDVFGVGMLLYFMCSKQNPYPGIFELPDFERMIQQNIIANHGSKLLSFKRVMSHIIRNCTHHDPKLRMGLSDVIVWLESMLNVEMENEINSSCPFLLKEAISPFLTSNWTVLSESSFSVKIGNLSKEVSIDISEKGEVVVFYRHGIQGHGDRDKKHVVDWLQKKADLFASSLNEQMCRISKKEIKHYAFEVSIQLLDKKWPIRDFNLLFSEVHSCIAKTNE